MHSDADIDAVAQHLILSVLGARIIVFPEWQF
jgi:hypothetical protein